MTTEDIARIVAWVDSYDDSPEGPIRYPGSIAESNQGLDPRYRPEMAAYPIPDDLK